MGSSWNKNARISTFDWFFAVLTGSLSLALYIRTLAPGVLPSDSGEFQVLAHQLGIAHCPGYPVYMVMAKLFTYLPIGGIAYRVNLFSAFMAALTVSGVYLACRILSLNRWAATFGALILAISYTFWSQAVIAEVYTAGAAFAIFILVLVLRWGQTGNNRLLFAAGLLGGLSLGVHMTTVLFAPGILVYLWLYRKENPGLWRVSAGGVLIGGVIFLAIFILLDLNYPSANIFNAVYDTARSDWGLSEDDIQKPWVRIWFVASSQQWRSALDFNWLEINPACGLRKSAVPGGKACFATA